MEVEADRRGGITDRSDGVREALIRVKLLSGLTFLHRSFARP